MCGGAMQRRKKEKTIFKDTTLNRNASRVYFCFKFLWGKNLGKLAGNSDFAGAGDRSRDLSRAR